MEQQTSAQQLRLDSTAYTKGQLNEAIQADNLPHVALAGRSNVGKSSLLNCLAGRKQLAKTSGTPGKTRSINFYYTEPPALVLADLPGYGYARCSKTERQVWEALIQYYLTQCPQLKAVVVLLDSRLEPQRLDLDLQSWLHNLQIPIIPVLTKADKCSQKHRAAKVKEWQAITGHDPVPFSAKTGLGRSQLWKRLFEAGEE